MTEIKDNINESKKRLIIISLGALFLFILVFVLSDHGLFRRFSLQYENNVLIDEISNLKIEADSLDKKAKSLQSDTLEIERIARENYGMARPKEKIIILR